MKLVITITRHSRILRPRCLTGPNGCEESLFSLLSSPRIAHPTARHSACPSQSFHVAQGLSLFLGPDAFCRESPQAFLSALAVICVWRLPACPLATASSLFHLFSTGFGGTFPHTLQSPACPHHYSCSYARLKGALCRPHRKPLPILGAILLASRRRTASGSVGVVMARMKSHPSGT